MAIANVGTIGNGVQAASSTTLVMTTTNQLDAGNAGVLVVSSDNIGNTGNTNDHSSVADSAGNTYTKIYEYTYSPGSTAADGCTNSLWTTKAASNLAGGGTCTVTFSGALVDACCSMEEFTLTNALELAQSPPQTSGANGTNPASLAISALSSQEYLFFRTVGKEANTTTALTATANHTAITGTRSRNGATAIIVRGEYRILTGTGDTSAPSLNVLADTVGIFAALKEGAGGGGGTANSYYYQRYQ